MILVEVRLKDVDEIIFSNISDQSFKDFAIKSATNDLNFIITDDLMLLKKDVISIREIKK